MKLWIKTETSCSKMCCSCYYGYSNDDACWDSCLPPIQDGGNNLAVIYEMADNEVPDSAAYPSTLTEEEIDTGATYDREAKQLIGLVTRLDRSQEEQRMIEAEATTLQRQ